MPGFRAGVQELVAGELDQGNARSASTTTTRLVGRDQEWRDRVEVAALDAFRGYNTARVLSDTLVEHVGVVWRR